MHRSKPPLPVRKSHTCPACLRIPPDGVPTGQCRLNLKAHQRVLCFLGETGIPEGVFLPDSLLSHSINYLSRLNRDVPFATLHQEFNNNVRASQHPFSPRPMANTAAPAQWPYHVPSHSSQPWDLSLHGHPAAGPTSSAPPQQPTIPAQFKVPPPPPPQQQFLPKAVPANVVIDQAGYLKKPTPVVAGFAATHPSTWPPHRLASAMPKSLPPQPYATSASQPLRALEQVVQNIHPTLGFQPPLPPGPPPAAPPQPAPPARQQPVQVAQVPPTDNNNNTDFGPHLSPSNFDLPHLPENFSPVSTDSAKATCGSINTPPLPQQDEQVNQ